MTDPLAPYRRNKTTVTEPPKETAGYVAFGGKDRVERLKIHFAKERTHAPSYLDGAFKAPGVYAWTNGMTLRDGVVSAGGLLPRSLHWIQVTHADGTSENIRLPEGAILQNPVLRPGDHITSFKP